ncbi:triosephosphate isomerase [Podospora didyma]|uniref:Triosephosphate isomerase n=1 Tax=Podospora didyma TaxID=330526 RepID=A0AAE0P044_9PEZI|nr:triosephosphate isomerase [Podospora didyma]
MTPSPPPPPAPGKGMRRRIVGVSTKMYFSAARTEAFVQDLLGMLESPPSSADAPGSDPRSGSETPHADFRSGSGSASGGGGNLLDLIDVFIIPDHITLAGVVRQTEMVKGRSKVIVGAQDCYSEDAGALTGEVSPAVLAEVGCGIVELGHAERRRLFGETDASTAAKAAAVARNGMLPLVCVGEVARVSTLEEGIDAATKEVLGQVRCVLAALPDDADVVLAYEPVWAIGASEPAPVEHVCGVVRRVRASAAVQGRTGQTRIVYGGSAGPGLFARLVGGEVDGLFLGRFAHDPAQFYRTICEVAEA